jgi:hypothetical protein
MLRMNNTHVTLLILTWAGLFNYAKKLLVDQSKRVNIGADI